MQAAPYYIYSLPAKAQHRPVPLLLLKDELVILGKCYALQLTLLFAPLATTLNSCIHLGNHPVNKTHFDSPPTPFWEKPAAHWKPPAFLQSNLRQLATNPSSTAE